MIRNGRFTAAYVRVSSDKQDTARQEASINASGLAVRHWFRDLEGKNPRDLPNKRAAFQEMLRAVEAGMVETIVVDRQDRFGVKDAYQWGRFIDVLREHGTRLIDASGKCLSGDDDVSILSGTLGALTSTREQKEKAHRNLSGKIGKAKRGEYQGGYAPYGCDVVCFGPDGREKWRTVYIGHYDRWKVFADGKRERFTGKNNAPSKDPCDTLRIRPSIEKERVKWATKIFSWYAEEAISPGKIAERLNSLGVDPVFAKHWYKVLVRGLLKNPAYIGLPTYNKNGASRFVEYVDGQLREVEKVNGKAKMGRKRKPADFIQPAQPEYTPIVSLDVWNTAQRKLAESSGNRKAQPRVADLWLRPFLVCGHCDKTMRASEGRYKGTTYPSYFCGTYGTYGKRNPAGCWCHRVKHDTLERIVLDYLEESAPEIRVLMEASKGTDLQAARPLIEAWIQANQFSDWTWLKMDLFVEEHLSREKRARAWKKGSNLEEVYGVLYNAMKPGIEREIGEREAKLEALLDGFTGLSPKLKERANKRGEALQEEIDQLREKLVDLREPYARFEEELVARREAIDMARAMIGRESSGLQKAESLSKVVAKIVCRFRHVEARRSKGKREIAGKSYLESVEIKAVSGEAVLVTMESSPGPG
jgi:DNA invertase Pin-like site-specific DNA recombinase